jgi:hypothetical protein
MPASAGTTFSQYAPETLRDLRRDLLWLRPVERIGLLGDEWWMARYRTSRRRRVSRARRRARRD